MARVPRTGTVQAAGVRVALRSWGEGGDTLVMLLHGGGAHAAWWDHIGPHLAVTGQVVATDLSGNGDSEWRREYQLDLWADEVRSAIDSLRAGRSVHVIGHSIGGIVALQAASAGNPASIASVIAVDPPIRLPSPEETRRRARLASSPTTVFPTETDVSSRWKPSPVQEVLPFIRDHVARTSSTPTAGGYTWKFDPSNFHRPLPDIAAWPQVDCPALVLRAENGMMPADLTVTFMKRLGTKASIVDLPGSFHHVMLDQPLVLIAAINAWLMAQSGVSA